MMIQAFGNGNISLLKNSQYIEMTREEAQSVYQHLAGLLGVGVITVFPPHSPAVTPDKGQGK